MNCLKWKERSPRRIIGHAKPLTNSNLASFNRSEAYSIFLFGYFLFNSPLPGILKSGSSPVTL